MSWGEFTCGSCGAPLPDKGNKRRRVPRKGGALKLVCVPCALEIDRQQTLLGELPRVGTQAPLRARRIA